MGVKRLVTQSYKIQKLPPTLNPAIIFRLDESVLIEMCIDIVGRVHINNVKVLMKRLVKDCRR